MKIVRINNSENREALANIISISMQTESAYETLKLKTEDASLFQWVENKQEATTDFIISLLRLQDELNYATKHVFGNKDVFSLQPVQAKSLIVSLDNDVLMRECKKIDEAHWYFIMEEMTKHHAASKIYQLLNRRLERLNNNFRLDENPSLLVS